MNQIVTITVPAGVDAGLLLRDALREFVSARTPTVDYVARRYNQHPQEFRDRKLDDVHRRIEAARAAIDSMVVTSEAQ